MTPHPLDDQEMRRRIRLVAERMRSQFPPDQSDIDDVEQQITLGVLKRLPRFDPARSPLGAFVTTAAKSAAKTAIRDATRAKRDPGRLRPVEDAAGAVAPDSDALDRRETRLRVEKAVSQLEDADADAAHDLARLGPSNARKRLGLNRSQWVQTTGRIRLTLIEQNLGIYS